MPTKRLPWFKLWIGCTAHGKVRQLDDGTFRTWVELLDAAAQQTPRGRFTSATEAVAITRRPSRHVRTLINAGLIDETVEGLYMHDWNAWQRWHAEDSPETPDPPPDQPVNDSRSTPDQHAIDTLKKEEVRVKNNPPFIPPGGKQKKGERRSMTEDDEGELVAKYTDRYGGDLLVRDEIAAALNHEARFKAIDERQYVDTWLRRGLDRRPVPLRTGNGAAPTATAVIEDNTGKGIWR